MLKIDRRSQTFEKIHGISLSDADVQERYDLQEWIFNSSKTFFQEIGEDLFVVGKEVRPSVEVGDRIDILALDAEGCSVVIELKRDNSKWHLLQALSYAAMVSGWERDTFEKFLDEARKAELDTFLGGVDEEFNLSQRVLLIAESFDYEVLVTAKWLTEFYAVRIACYRIALVRDAVHGSEYLSCVQVFPPKELTAEVLRRGIAHVASSSKAKSLMERLAQCKNSAVVDFVKARLSQEQRLNSRQNNLVYPQKGKMRWKLRVRTWYAGIVQLGRFDDDEKLWTNSLSDANLHVRSNNQLSFRLKTESDILFFQGLMDGEADRFHWTLSALADDDSDDEES